MIESAADRLRGHGSVSAAVLRFWWVVAIGAVVGIGLALSMVYQLPSFTPRDQPVYTSAARLFVTSTQGQYIRLSVPRAIDTGASDDAGPAGRVDSAGSGPAVIQESPNVQPLLAAANLYPLLIESDQVAQQRDKMFGPLSGTVQANAVTAVSTPSRYAAAQLPVIDILASAGSERDAVTLAEATATAFDRYIRLEQNRAGISQEERILIQVLQAPSGAFATGGASYGIPVLVTLAVMAAFGLLAVVLDQLFPPAVRVSQLRSETS
jgi:hypothetical protein